MALSAAYLAAFTVFTILTLTQVNSVVKEPYMDEPFHVPQAQAYCAGNWSQWDDKITTPPGLLVH
jgi:alpha-1,2-glucosyltransferase